MENTVYSKYVGVTQDITLNYNEHIQDTNMKVDKWNNLMRRLANSKWETNTGTIRTTLVLCYWVAEYAAPVWWRSKHTNLLDHEKGNCRYETTPPH